MVYTTTLTAPAFALRRQIDRLLEQSLGHDHTGHGDWVPAVDIRETEGELTFSVELPGVRPEDVHDPNFAPPGIHIALVPSRVEVTELMGNEVFLYLKTGERNYVARVDPRSQARIGNDIQVAFNLDNMQLFDKTTELAIR